MILKSEIRSADYRLKAEQARVAADGAALDQVRRRHEAAAEVWSDLAAFEERRSAGARDAVERMQVSKAVS